MVFLGRDDAAEAVHEGLIQPRAFCGNGRPWFEWVDGLDSKQLWCIWLILHVSLGQCVLDFLQLKRGRDRSCANPFDFDRGPIDILRRGLYRGFMVNGRPL